MNPIIPFIGILIVLVITDIVLRRVFGGDDEDKEEITWSDKINSRLPNGMRTESIIDLLVYTNNTSYFDRMKGWRKWNDIGIVLFITSGVFMLFNLGITVYTYLFTDVVSDSVGQTVTDPSNALVIPGLNDFLPLFEITAIIIALVIGMIVHEFGHGIAARTADIEVEEIGLGFLFWFVPVAAYVEIPKQKIREAPVRDALRVLVAGVMNNYALTIVTVIIAYIMNINLLGIMLDMISLEMPNLSLIKGVIYWSFFLNVNLGLFNTLPIYGLDGGEVVKRLEIAGILPNGSTRVLTILTLQLLLSLFIVGHYFVF